MGSPKKSSAGQTRVTINSVNPGITTSAVSLGLGFDLDRSDESAAGCAEGPVFVAFGPLGGLLDPTTDRTRRINDAGQAFLDAESPS